MLWNSTIFSQSFMKVLWNFWYLSINILHACICNDASFLSCFRNLFHSCTKCTCISQNFHKVAHFVSFTQQLVNVYMKRFTKHKHISQNLSTVHKILFYAPPIHFFVLLFTFMLRKICAYATCYSKVAFSKCTPLNACIQGVHKFFDKFIGSWLSERCSNGGVGGYYGPVTYPVG